MDELAFNLGIDPIELRRINEPDKEPISGKPYSCRRLIQCLDTGAAAFGWERRTQRPRSVREGHLLIGYGYATATYPMKGSPCQARCRILADGQILVQSSTHDFGNGIATSARQIAADALGVAYDDITFEYGDSDLPPVMQTGGSTTTMWVGTAIKEACEQAKALLGELGSASTPDDFAELLKKSGRGHVEATAEASPSKATAKQYSMNSFGAHFCEVAVDADLG